MRSRIRVLPDGREKCTGYQWTKRVRELKKRAEGFCEAEAILDGHPRHYIGDEGDPHHVIKRSKARNDSLKNLLWICRAAHIEIHEKMRSAGRKGVWRRDIKREAVAGSVR